MWLYLQDRERREDELNELRHLLEENHTTVTKWKTDAVEKAKVCVSVCVSDLERGRLHIKKIKD